VTNYIRRFYDATGSRVFVWAVHANNRIQIFDQDGKFLEGWTPFSRPSGIYIDKNDIMCGHSNRVGVEKAARSR
jgi:hypothetical protein